ncbi:hypothetical protein AXF42_Ash006123 [Apostasia shenzhenica]|uniref:Uncharacterized protein n=1 Tax=Apostasia shenzhenica TaxID=1088818 RepID=A0A2I0B0B4_9ASPA|nr:hypothetical protein AXF42_Ash006123 [Apostasia shenzhenica]
MELSSLSSSRLRNPNTGVDWCTNPSLRTANSPSFKRENRRKRKKRKRQEKLQQLLDNWIPLAEQCRCAGRSAPAAAAFIEWPLDPASDRNLEPAGAWSAPNPRPPLLSHPLPPASAGEVAQQNALRLCREFFSLDDFSDEEERGDDDRSGGKIFEFFKGLFEKERELGNFYRNDSSNGDFLCLVCGGVGEKLGKRYAGLLGLVQHANFVSKTKKLMAHRSYGRVVCELLGWETYRSGCDHDVDESLPEVRFMNESDVQTLACLIF